MPITMDKQPIIGGVTELAVAITEHWGTTFTLSSATITITTLDGTVIRNAVSATVDNTSTPKRAYYKETFAAGTSSTSYYADTDYLVSFRLVTSDGYTEAFEGKFRVLGTARA